jgi:hypothetical protein
MDFKDPTYLDNEKLDGFIKFFMEGKCKLGNCEKCGYCRSIAEKVLNIPTEYKDKMLNLSSSLLKDIINGSLFYCNKKGGGAP